MPFVLASAGSAEEPRILDYHVHYFTEEVVEAIQATGFDFSAAGYRYLPGPDLYEVERILENTPGELVLNSGGFNLRDIEEPERLEAAVQRENDRLAAAVRAHPNRLKGFCGLDPLADHVLRELARCRDELGLHGIKLHLPISGVDLGRPEHLERMSALFTELAADPVPALVHTHIRDMAGSAYAERFIGALLEPHEGLTVIFAHAGGGSSYDEPTHGFLKTFAWYLGHRADPGRNRIYFELSGIFAGDRFPEGSARELVELVEGIGEEHFLFGSDYPMRDGREYLDEISDRLPLDPGVLAAIAARDVFAAR